MKKVVGDCGRSDICPTIWEADDGDLLVQGYIVSAGVLAEIAPPDGESVVKIPRSLLMKFANEAADMSREPAEAAR